jgi:SAM-dependent methyltransferase
MSQPLRQLADSRYLQVAAGLTAGLKSQSREALALFPGATVLDAGCGPGTDVHALSATTTCRTVGVDLDRAMLAAARANARPGTSTEFVCANAARLPFPDNTFDATRSDRMLQHLPDPGSAVAEIVRVTRPGGRLVLIDTDWASLTIEGTGDPATAQLLTAIILRQVAASPTAGRDLPLHAAHASAQILKVSQTTIASGDATLLRLIAHLDMAENAAMAAGLLDAVGLAAWRSRLSAASRNGALQSSLTLTMLLAASPA